MMKPIRSIVIKVLTGMNLMPSTGDRTFFMESENHSSLVDSLNEIPSETSLNERLLLYWLARSCGETGNVLEIGPFLGGTTRALAMGIHDNPFCKERRVISIDRFQDYYPASMFKSMNVAGVDHHSDDMMISFYDIFKEYHRDQPYESLIESVQLSLPDSKSENWTPSVISQNAPYSVVLVDGCKSWFSVKALFQELENRLETGSYVIFQDYGRFTCFWISAFCEVFKDHFAYYGEVDSSRVYRYTGGLTADMIQENYTDAPTEWTMDQVNILFDKLDQTANKPFHVTLFQIQRAGFLAYIGEKDEARSILRSHLESLNQKSREYSLTREAMVSPTYTPQADVLL